MKLSSVILALAISTARAQLDRRKLYSTCSDGASGENCYIEHEDAHSDTGYCYGTPKRCSLDQAACTGKDISASSGSWQDHNYYGWSLPQCSVCTADAVQYD